MSLVLNVPEFWIYQSYEFAFGFKHARIVNISTLNMAGYTGFRVCMNNSWICLNMLEYAWICLNLPEWLLFYISLVVTLHYTWLLTRFFISNVFFSSASLLLNFLKNWVSNVAWVLFLQRRHNLTETRYIFYICLSVYALVGICLIYVIYFAIMIFIFIAINHIISLKQANSFFGHVCQKFSHRVLLSFCLNFCQFQRGVAYKSVANKKPCIWTSAGG